MMTVRYSERVGDQNTSNLFKARTSTKRLATQELMLTGQDFEQLAEVESTIINRLKRARFFDLWNTTCRPSLVRDYPDYPIERDHSALQVGLLTPEELDRLLMVLSACQSA